MRDSAGTTAIGGNRELSDEGAAAAGTAGGERANAASPGNPGGDAPSGEERFRGPASPEAAAAPEASPASAVAGGAAADAAPPIAPEFSVVIPLYNEEDNVEPLLRGIREALDPLRRPYEVLVIDDGSTDRSLERLRGEATRDPRLRVLCFAANRGQSAAFVAGFDAARGAVVVTMDADLQNDPRDIPALLDQIPAYDLACGWRMKRQDSFLRRISSRVANRIRNWLSEETIRDTGCSLKAFKRVTLPRMHRFVGMHRFFPTLVKMQGFRVTELPVRHHPRVHGASKYGVLNRAFRTFLDLLAVRWLKKRTIRYDVREEIGAVRRDVPNG